MKLYDLLNVMDTCGLHCNIYIQGDEEFGPIFRGSMYDIPYWLADLPIGDEDDGEKPIFYATNIQRPEYSLCPEDKSYDGFVITVKEERE